MKKTKPEAINPADLVRPQVRALQPYTPGEQPGTDGVIKLNTNENPYGPSPKVLRALREALDERLRLYPPSTADALREALARRHGCTPAHIAVGNGMDELLALATRAFVNCSLPGASEHYRFYHSHGAAKVSRCTVQYFTPSYTLYPVLADIHGAQKNPVPLQMDFALPTVNELRRGKVWDFAAALTFITTPNAPTGRGYPREALEEIVRAQERVVVLDEAYVDFADGDALPLALKYPHVLVFRTFSKAYSLCALRVGYAVGHPELIAALLKIKDSYNVNGPAQIAARATLEDPDYYAGTIAKVRATRAWLTQNLEDLGFTVLPSQTNFLFVRPPAHPAEVWQQRLREHNILVRWFDTVETRTYLRITVGRDNEARALVDAAKKILAAKD